MTTSDNEVDLLRAEVAQLRQRIAELEQAEGASLRSARMEVASTLAGGVAHRVNNLMTVVLSNAELLREGMDPGDSTLLVDAIVHAASQAAELANQMVGFAEGGKYRPTTVFLNSLIQNVVALWSSQQDLQHVDIRTDLAADLYAVHADAAQMSQVLVNLLNNAREALPPQGGVITITTANRQPEHDAPEMAAESLIGAYVALTVQDSGSGMSAAVLERVFEPFFTTRFQGRGLGLPAAYGIVHNHGGYVQIQSREGIGTTVSIWLPALITMPESLRIPALPLGQQSLATILLIEDFADIRFITRRLLERLGLNVLVATNGEEALQIIRQFTGPIQVALLNLDMPVMDGVSVFPLLRQERPEMQIVIYSGYDENDDVQMLLATGATAFVHKPPQLGELRSVIYRLLDTNGGSAHDPGGSQEL